MGRKRGRLRARQGSGEASEQARGAARENDAIRAASIADPQGPSCTHLSAITLIERLSHSLPASASGISLVSSAPNPSKTEAGETTPIDRKYLGEGWFLINSGPCGIETAAFPSPVQAPQPPISVRRSGERDPVERDDESEVVEPPRYIVVSRDLHAATALRSVSVSCHARSWPLGGKLLRVHLARTRGRGQPSQPSTSIRKPGDVDMKARALPGFRSCLLGRGMDD